MQQIKKNHNDTDYLLDWEELHLISYDIHVQERKKNLLLGIGNVQHYYYCNCQSLTAISLYVVLTNYIFTPS